MKAMVGCILMMLVLSGCAQQKFSFILVSPTGEETRKCDFTLYGTTVGGDAERKVWEHLDQKCLPPFIEAGYWVKYKCRDQVCQKYDKGEYLHLKNLLK